MEGVFGVTAPIYLLMALGFAAVRRGWMAPADMRVLGRFVAQFCVPALLFRALSRQALREVLHVDYLVAYAIGSLLSFFTVLLVARRVRERPLTLAALQGLGAAGSNSAFVGYPIVQQLIGPFAGVALALTTLVENLLVIPLALALADADGADGRRVGELLRTVGGNLVRNPMLIAIVAGGVVSASGVSLPSVLDRSIALAAGAAAPTALFVIGGTLVGLRLGGLRGDLVLVTAGKLLLHPACMLAVVLLVPVHDPALRAAAVLFAAMPMLSIYPLLAQRHGHDRFSAAALLAATLGSFVSISALIAVLPAGWLPVK